MSSLADVPEQSKLTGSKRGISEKHLAEEILVPLQYLFCRLNVKYTCNRYIFQSSINFYYRENSFLSKLQINSNVEFGLAAFRLPRV